VGFLHKRCLYLQTDVRMVSSVLDRPVPPESRYSPPCSSPSCPHLLTAAFNFSRIQPKAIVYGRKQHKRVECTFLTGVSIADAEQATLHDLALLFPLTHDILNNCSIPSVQQCKRYRTTRTKMLPVGCIGVKSLSSTKF